MKIAWTDYRTWRAAAYGLAVLAAVVALAAGLGEWRGRQALAAAQAEGGSAPVQVPTVDETVLATASAWESFEGGGAAPKASAGNGALAARYRLAGIFMVFQGAEARGTSQTRCAILDDVQQGTQLLAEEGERAGDVRVVRIENEYVLLGDGVHEEMVFLAPPAIASDGSRGDSDGDRATAGAAPTILETNRFGARVGDARWEISRAELMKYAQEVMDDPQRVSAMYLGMEPDYDDEHSVAGYRLNTACGEAEFYAQVGFQHGDIVRRVNSIKMTSQRRAEFMLSQFFEGQLGTFVFDIERDGEPMKLIYMLR